MTGMQDLLRDLESEVWYTRSFIGKDRLDPRVMEAMARVPREQFVPPELRAAAFENGPLPIGHGQTISQPYIVALMTDLIAPTEQSVVLEVGTGSGYQAAVLAEVVGRVYSLEVVPTLAVEAADRLARLGYTNVSVRQGDGHYGWPEHAPYDGILVTAAAPRVPPALIEQLRPGGRLVAPVGLPYMGQSLMLYHKDEQGELTIKDVLGVAFVPLTGAPDGRERDA